MSYLDEDFLLHSAQARTLYHDWAETEPIFDYHCHLPPEAVSENRRFENLAEVWLEGDHYKWRAMRSNGVDETLCTGSADPYEKFLAYCQTLTHCLRNPLYDWSHLELKRCFGIDLPINEQNAERIWKEANEKLKDDSLSAHGLLRGFQVRLVGTTDDPTDSLEHHQAAKERQTPTCMVPTFRPDPALKVREAASFNHWCDQLAVASGTKLSTFDDFIEALSKRHTFFHEMGGRASDHGLSRALYRPTSLAEVSAVFERVRQEGTDASADEAEAFGFWVMREVGRWNAQRGWVMQLHLGAMRSNNTRMFEQLGPDTGFDSIGDYPQAETLSRFLDSLDVDERLPKTILYNLNGNDNYAFATMLGNFQDGSVPGKMQLGSGWWFNDQKEGMTAQINALSNLGLLSRFVGMLTDSRSLLSYCRHEYFRRLLCNIIGSEMASGDIPDDMELAGTMVRNICYRNAVEYFGMTELL